MKELWETNRNHRIYRRKGKRFALFEGNDFIFGVKIFLFLTCLLSRFILSLEFLEINKFSFICFPYDANNEIHGFSYPKINEYADCDVQMVARGGFFGGPKDSIAEVNSIYYSLLINNRFKKIPINYFL